MILLILFFNIGLVNSSENDINNVDQILKNIHLSEFRENLELIPLIEEEGLRLQLNFLNSILYQRDEKDREYFSILFEKLNDENETKGIYLINKGYYDLFYFKEKSGSFNLFYDAYILSKKSDNKELLKLSLAAILELYSSGILQNTQNFKRYLSEYLDLLSTSEEMINYYYVSVKLFGVSNLYGGKLDQEELNFVQRLRLSANDINSEDPLMYKYYYTMGTIFFATKKYSKSKEFYQKIISEKNQDPFQQIILFNSYLKLAHIGLETDMTTVFDFIYKAENETKSNLSISNQFAISLYRSNYFERINDTINAFESLKKSNDLRYKLNFIKSNELITETEIENRTQEQEKENKRLIKEKSYLLFGTIIFVLLSVSISILIIKNSRRKRLIAIQEKELETQKNLTLLKEQEISTINAMVEGQEKERKRVAEDLHDNLGSVIATLKLHFDNLRINREKKKVDQETLFEKTENLIDEAYKKVRSIAHAKNAGVIANDGLLVAVKLMAEKISSANSIQIDVIDYGLEKPIENSLEISLFRIIQELTTNIIKHAQADHATINITQDEDEITILIEDNGVGFDSSIIDLKKGMGLHSIQTRVEHLEGNLTIDSTPTKGTTIIIHIPT